MAATALTMGVVPAVAAATTDPAPAATKTVGVIDRPGIRGLPDGGVVAGYWNKWEGHPIAQTNTDLNMLNLAFGVGDGNGGLVFDQQVQDDASFHADVTAFQAQGGRVVLSIGGQNGNVSLQDPAAIVDSVERIRTQEVPIDGIDWDLEGDQINVPAMVQISRELKTRYGPGFVITAAPQGGKDGEYADLAAQLGDDIDLIAIQIYDGDHLTPDERTDAALSRLATYTDAGIPEHKLGLGFRVTDNAGQYVPEGQTSPWSAPSDAAATYAEVKNTYPDLGGAFVWTTNDDATNGSAWVESVAPLITDQPTSDSEPEPTPATETTATPTGADTTLQDPTPQAPTPTAAAENTAPAPAPTTTSTGGLTITIHPAQPAPTAAAPTAAPDPAPATPAPSAPAPDPVTVQPAHPTSPTPTPSAPTSPASSAPSPSGTPAPSSAPTPSSAPKPTVTTGPRPLPTTLAPTPEVTPTPPAADPSPAPAPSSTSSLPPRLAPSAGAGPVTLTPVPGPTQTGATGDQPATVLPARLGGGTRIVVKASTDDPRTVDVVLHDIAITITGDLSRGVALSAGAL